MQSSYNWNLVVEKESSKCTMWTSANCFFHRMLRFSPHNRYTTSINRKTERSWSDILTFRNMIHTIVILWSSNSFQAWVKVYILVLLTISVKLIGHFPLGAFYRRKFVYKSIWSLHSCSYIKRCSFVHSVLVDRKFQRVFGYFMSLMALMIPSNSAIFVAHIS